MVYYINIGSNLGNRLMNLTRAVSAIEKNSDGSNSPTISNPNRGGSIPRTNS